MGQPFVGWLRRRTLAQISGFLGFTAYCFAVSLVGREFDLSERAAAVPDLIAALYGEEGSRAALAGLPTLLWAAAVLVTLSIRSSVARKARTGTVVPPISPHASASSSPTTLAAIAVSTEARPLDVAQLLAAIAYALSVLAGVGTYFAAEMHSHADRVLLAGLTLSVLVSVSWMLEVPYYHLPELIRHSELASARADLVAALRDRNYVPVGTLRNASGRFVDEAAEAGIERDDERLCLVVRASADEGGMVPDIRLQAACDGVLVDVYRRPWVSGGDSPSKRGVVRRGIGVQLVTAAVSPFISWLLWLAASAGGLPVM